MQKTIRWSLVISEDADLSLRTYLARNGRMRKGDLSRFVEEAVRWRILDATVEKVKKDNSQFSESELDAAIDEALASVRAGKATPVA